MKTTRCALILLTAVSLQSCAFKTAAQRQECACDREVEDLISSLDQAYKTHQENLIKAREDIDWLYKASQSEFSKIAKQLADIRMKTDHIDVQSSNGASLIQPSGALIGTGEQNGAVTAAGGYLKDVNFWQRSGGKNPNAPGNRKYLFSVNVPGNATISLNSRFADSYLFLATEAGDLIYQDDNSGDGRNARIEAFLEQGVYQIIAATAQADESETFNLSISGVTGSLQQL